MGKAKEEFLTDAVIKKGQRDHEGKKKKKKHQGSHELQKHRSSSEHLEGG